MKATVTGCTAVFAAFTVTVIRSEPGSAPLSAAEAVIVWTPAESAAVENEPPVPMVETAKYSTCSRKRLIDRGMRLRLGQLGLTGAAYIEADFVDAEANPPMQIGWKPDYIYVPSAPSTLAQISTAAERIFTRLDNLDVERVVLDLDNFLSRLTDSIDGVHLTAHATSSECRWRA